MRAVVNSGISVVADTLLLPGTGALIVELLKLAKELHGSKQLCQELIARLQPLQSALEDLHSKGLIKNTKALTQYDTLVKNVLHFLKEHVQAKFLARMGRHWKMKESIQEFHAEVDTIRILVGLEHQVEMAERHKEIQARNDRIEKLWREEFAAIKEKIANQPAAIASALESQASTQSALNDLKYQYKYHESELTRDDIEAMEKIFSLVRQRTGAKPDHLSKWYISRAEIRFDPTTPFVAGKYQSLHHGTMYSGTKVIVKTAQIDATDEENRATFVRETKLWYSLRNRHVLPLHHACHVGSPLFHVTDFAELGNFNEFLREPANRHRFWHVFLDAACGLEYLHRMKKIVHGNLKCSNLLVKRDGSAVLSDFLFAFVRASSALSLKEQAPSYYWKAPECFAVGKDGNPRFQSDVYALGMCIFEAMAGEKPYHLESEDEAIAKIQRGELPEGPLEDGDHRRRITGEAWNLIARMCKRNYQDRPSIEEVIKEFQKLADQEDHETPSVTAAATTQQLALAPGGVTSNFVAAVITVLVQFWHAITRSQR